MSGWIVVQIILNISFIAAALACWARLNRPQKDDPRLSRGLQLLQSKIAILEDLSDRTDLQVKQLSTLLDQKGRELQEYVAAAQSHINKVEMSIQKSIDVSQIIQDKIPHKEIIERQNTIKYVQAAKLAHQGLSAEQIAAKIDIPRSELDFIVKVNKNRLMFSEEHLPAWVQDSIENNTSEKSVEKDIAPRDLSNVFESPSLSASAQEDNKKIQEEFKKAIEEMKAKDIERENSVTESMSEGIQTAKNKISGLAEKILNPHFVDILNTNSESQKPSIEKPSEKIVSQKVIKGESEDARALRPFVFKKLNEDKMDI